MSILGAENTCTIYHIRPLACRSFYAPDADRCKSAMEALVKGGGDLTVTSHGVPQLVGCAARAGIDGVAKDLGLQHDDVDLVSTIDAIRKDPEVIDRWAAGESVFLPRIQPGQRPRVVAPNS